MKTYDIKSRPSNDFINQVKGSINPLLASALESVGEVVYNDKGNVALVFGQDTEGNLIYARLDVAVTKTLNPAEKKSKPKAKKEPVTFTLFDDNDGE